MIDRVPFGAAGPPIRVGPERLIVVAVTDRTVHAVALNADGETYRAFSFEATPGEPQRISIPHEEDEP